MQQRNKSEKRDMFSETGGKKIVVQLKKKIKGMEDKVKNYFKQENKRESA